MIYNIVYTALASLSIITIDKHTRALSAYWAVLAFLFIFIAFRWEVGCDFLTYQTLSDATNLTIEDAFTRSENGFWLIIFGLDKLGWDFPAVNFVGAAIFLAGLNAISRRQPNPVLYLALTFPVLITNIGMSAVRQAIAIGFFCFAINAFIDRRPIRFVFSIALAFCFHRSTVAMIVLLPFALNISQRLRVTLGIAVAPVMAWALLNSDTFDAYRSAYVSTGVDAAGGSSRALLLSITGLTFVAALKKRWKERSPSDYLLVYLCSVGMIGILPLTLYSTVIGDRFGYYLVPIAALIQSKAFSLTDRNRQLYLILPLLVNGLALLIWTQMSSLFELCYSPYKIWGIDN